MGRSATAGSRWRAAICRLLLVVWATGCGITLPAIAEDKLAARSIATTADQAVLASEILNRWEPVAVQAGAHSTAWREIFATQLATMDISILRGIYRLKVGAPVDANASYAQFAQAIRGAEVQSFQIATAVSGKGPAKLASTTTDQIFIPVVPCRIVDTRNVGGPIAAGTARNFNFYANTTGYDWAGQGGVAGLASATCPGTVNPNGGPPSAAVVTVTVVSPTAAGNWVIWGGANPQPTISALNWNAGEIAANTTVIPGGGRSGTGPGGAVQDFGVAYNGPSGSAQFVADVVGYLVENRATALECSMTAYSHGVVPAGQALRLAAGACPSGWTLTSGSCDSGDHLNADLVSEYQQGAFPQAAWTCAFESHGGGIDIYAATICCRVPGR